MNTSPQLAINAEGTPGFRDGDGQGRRMATSGGMGSTSDDETGGAGAGAGVAVGGGSDVVVGGDGCGSVPGLPAATALGEGATAHCSG